MNDHVVVFGFERKREARRNFAEILEGTEKFYERILKCNVSHSSNGIQLKYDKYGILKCTNMTNMEY